MLYWMCNNSKGHPLSWPQLEHAIRRNFGGLESKDLNPLEEFKREIGPMRDTDEDLEDSDEVCGAPLEGMVSLIIRETTTFADN